MTTKREYRDRYYIILGLIIGGSMSILSSFAAGAYFTLFPEPDKITFIVTFIGAICLFIAGLIVLMSLEKKIK